MQLSALFVAAHLLSVGYATPIAHRSTSFVDLPVDELTNIPCTGIPFGSASPAKGVCLSLSGNCVQIIASENQLLAKDAPECAAVKARKGKDQSRQRNRVQGQD